MDGLVLSSSAFSDSQPIPAKYSVDGENISPPLSISGVSEASKSLVLVMDDPDAPGGTYVHWVLFNIPPTTIEIAEGTAPAGAVVGVNSAGQNGYMGPAPPSGQHRYFFKLYELPISLELDQTADKAAVEAAMAGKMAQRAQLVGLHQRA